MRPVIFKLRTSFGRKILFFYLNLKIVNVKIKRFNVKSKQDFNRIRANCARGTDTSISNYRRLRPLESRVDCAHQTDALIRVSFWTKNWMQSAVLLLHITADCAWWMDVQTQIQFRQSYDSIFWIK